MALAIETHQIARRYATALLNEVLDNNSLDAVCKDIEVLHNTLKTHENLSHILRSPALGITESQGILQKITAGLKSGKEIKGLCAILAKNRRAFVLENVISVFNQLVLQHKNIVTAQVTSAVEMDEKQKKAIKDTLEKTVDGGVHIEYINNPKILGGLIVKVGSKMIDSSVRTKLEKIKLNMRGA